MIAHRISCVLTTWSTDRPALQALRREVFVAEQGFPEEEEWDGLDPVCMHALATLNREPVGTGRLTAEGKIGRVAVKAEHRGRGIGSMIIRLLLREAYRRGARAPYLHAQVQAVRFYEQLGFRTEGEIFDEAGVPHVRMVHVLE